MNLETFPGDIYIKSTADHTIQCHMKFCQPRYSAYKKGGKGGSNFLSKQVQLIAKRFGTTSEMVE